MTIFFPEPYSRHDQTVIRIGIPDLAEVKLVSGSQEVSHDHFLK